mgnify:CR=1 FL=1|tara:strand:- start:1432 stop:1713 length:282 start_codon:yes stop_codon:yes gene_type:complete
MATQTLANMTLDVQAVTTAGVSFTLNANLQTLVLQARGGVIQVKFGAVGDTEYWTLTDAQPQSFSVPDLAGRAILFDSGSNLNVEIIQMLTEN